MKYEISGQFKPLRFDEQTKKKQNELINKSAGIIAKSDFFKTMEKKQNSTKNIFQRLGNAQSKNQNLSLDGGYFSDKILLVPPSLTLICPHIHR